MVTTGNLAGDVGQAGRAGRRAQVPGAHKVRDPAVARGDGGA